MSHDILGKRQAGRNNTGRKRLKLECKSAAYGGSENLRGFDFGLGDGRDVILHNV
jgi:hypothetical protein